MELRHIRYFIVAAEEQHFGRAAERLNVSQPALSQQIRDLEQDLGVVLFDRLKRGVSLSIAGQVFLNGIRPVLAEIEEVSQRSRMAGLGQVGHLRVALNEFALAHAPVAKALKAFRKTLSQIDLEILPMRSDAQIEALRAGAIDAGFMYHRPGADRRLSHLRIARDEYVLAVPRDHALARRRRVSLNDLRDEPLISIRRSMDAPFFEKLNRTFSSAGIALRIFQEVDNHATVLDLVSVGMGIAFILDCKPFQIPPGVVLKRVHDLSIVNELDLVWQTDNKAPALSQFVALVKRL